MSQTEWNAEDYQRHADFVPKLGGDVLALLNPSTDESILDLGCGDGALSEVIAQSGCNLLAVDASADMVASARQKRLNAEQVDGHALAYENEFDAVFSNAALHWMTQPKQVIDGVWRALKPGGRFVAEFGGQGNIQTLVDAMSKAFHDHPDWGEFCNPWYFPAAETYQNLLESQGFEVEVCQLHPRPTVVGESIHGWLKVFTSGFTEHLNSDQTARFYQTIEHALQPNIDPNTGLLNLDYVRLRIKAIKPQAVC